MPYIMEVYFCTEVWIYGFEISCRTYSVCTVDRERIERSGAMHHLMSASAAKTTGDPIREDDQRMIVTITSARLKQRFSNHFTS